LNPVSDLKYFLEVSITTFVSFNLLYVIWLFFIISSETASGFNGSIMYVPHAARVITICYFGIAAIPALFAAHVFCTLVIGDAYGLNNLLLIDLFATSFLSTICVFIALYAMAGLGFKLRTLPFYEFTKDSIYLDLRNHKHIIMVTVFSAAVHSLSLYVYNSLRAISSNPEMFIRFFVGDILGTLVTIFTLSFMIFAFFRER
jgi:hypothetical protein